jgi:hypothetical protein
LGTFFGSAKQLGTDRKIVICNIFNGIDISERMEKLGGCKKYDIDDFIRRENQWSVPKKNLKEDEEN